jgi:hypothetical protein
VAFGQKTYNGVAILTRTAPTAVVRNIPGFEDEQARVIAATVETPQGPLRVVNGYFVNGQAPGTDKFAYKMRWLQALHDWVATELAAHPRLVLLGDFNVAPEDRDFTTRWAWRAPSTTHPKSVGTSRRCCPGPWMRSACSSSPTRAFVVGLPHAGLPEEPRPAHRLFLRRCARRRPAPSTAPAQEPPTQRPRAGGAWSRHFNLLLFL